MFEHADLFTNNSMFKFHVFLLLIEQQLTLSVCDDVNWVTFKFLRVLVPDSLRPLLFLWSLCVNYFYYSFSCISIMNRFYTYIYNLYSLFLQTWCIVGWVDHKESDSETAQRGEDEKNQCVISLLLAVNGLAWNSNSKPSRHCMHNERSVSGLCGQWHACFLNIY